MYGMHKGYLDGEKCYRYWHAECGTLRRVANRLVAEGVVNPDSGKPYTNSAIQQASWRWAIAHPEEAYPIAEKEAATVGNILTREQFYKDLVQLAGSYVWRNSKTNYRRLISNPVLLPYAPLDLNPTKLA